MCPIWSHRRWNWRPLLEAILDKLRTIIEYRDAKIFISQGDRVSVIAHRSKLKPEQERTYSLPLEKDILRKAGGHR